MSSLVISKQAGFLQVLAKSYGKEWLFVANHFLNYKTVVGFPNHCSFVGTQVKFKGLK